MPNTAKVTLIHLASLEFKSFFQKLPTVRTVCLQILHFCLFLFRRVLSRCVTVQLLNNLKKNELNRPNWLQAERLNIIEPLQWIIKILKDVFLINTLDLDIGKRLLLRFTREVWSRQVHVLVVGLTGLRIEKLVRDRLVDGIL